MTFDTAPPPTHAREGSPHLLDDFHLLYRPSTVGSMTETDEAAEPQVCPICGALVGNQQLHAQWHEGLPRAMARPVDQELGRQLR